jgi:acetate kinase
MNILVLNSGSSSLKAHLYADGDEIRWKASADWGRKPGFAHVRVNEDESEIEAAPGAVFDSVLRRLPAATEIGVVGHRVVHGGPAFRESVRIDAAVRSGIEKYCEFAPEHNWIALEGIGAAERVFGPEMPQIAVFDTAFHTTLPEPARIYPLPYELFGKGIWRYGFHGISHQYVSRRAAEMLGRPLCIVSCHLGNGASLAAVRDGVSVDTTMGFTPLDGIMMGTRSGAVDPGILIYLMRHRGLGADQMDRMLNRESGLKGVSGISGDMREIVTAMERGDARAKLAFDAYVQSLCRGIGAMAASLGAMDAIVFTAGIGENSPPLRSSVCERLAFLGIELDPDRNGQVKDDADIAAAGSRVRVLVVHTDEDREIARECRRLTGSVRS